MVFNKEKKQAENPATDRVAEQIASVIIRWQQAIATKANQYINLVSSSGQKKILWTFCTVWSVLLIISIQVIQKKQPVINSGKNQSPVHIGQPSKPPKKAIKNYQKTDSLTTKQ